MKRMVFFFIALMGVVAFSLPAMAAEKPIVIGFPMWLSGGGGLFGQPSAKGAEMLVKEVNDAGGVLGRKIELLVRDCKGTPEEATRVSKELILKDNVDFLVGGLSASQGLAISEVAKQEKILYIAPISKAAEMCEPPRLHPYVFRAAANTNTEGRSAAVFMAKNPWKRIATIGPDYAYGQGVTKAFVDWMKKIKPEAEIVHQAWPKLGETDYTPFISPVLAAKPDAAFISLWGGHFVTFAKQAKDYGFFEKVKVVAAGEAGSPETGRALKDEMPLGITSNSYEVFYYPDTPEHNAYIKRLREFTGDEYGSSWASTGYIAMQFLVEGIKKAGSTDTDKVIKALEDLTIETPIGKQTMRAKDHQATRGQFWGTTAKVSEYPFPILRPVEYIPAEGLME
ncbi:MAG: ABC transporter substrate-binding protein [Desulfobulbaceae bacterium]|nr:ABC transporter substrate-binding protein [Desulfobulbaceae bacterium]